MNIKDGFLWQCAINSQEGRISQAGRITKRFRVLRVEGLERKLTDSLKDIPLQTRAEIERTRKALSEVEKEISSTFKLQLQISNRTEASQLTAEHLDKLGRQKKILMSRLIDLEEMELKQKDAGDIQDDIKAKILEFKRGFPKAPAAVRRRLLQKVFGKLVYTSKGLEAFFIYEDGSDIVNQKFQESEGKLLKFEKKNQSKPLLSGAESDLTLSFQNLQVVGIGWGRRTRTSE